ncbi:hypothetical protein [Spongorhabdus nitratireducens]
MKPQRIARLSAVVLVSLIPGLMQASYVQAEEEVQNRNSDIAEITIDPENTDSSLSTQALRGLCRRGNPTWQSSTGGRCHPTLDAEAMMKVPSFFARVTGRSVKDKTLTGTLTGRLFQGPGRSILLMLEHSHIVFPVRLDTPWQAIKPENLAAQGTRVRVMIDVSYMLIKDKDDFFSYGWLDRIHANPAPLVTRLEFL